MNEGRRRCGLRAVESRLQINPQEKLVMKGAAGEGAFGSHSRGLANQNAGQ